MENFTNTVELFSATEENKKRSGAKPWIQNHQKSVAEKFEKYSDHQRIPTAEKEKKFKKQKTQVKKPFTKQWETTLRWTLEKVVKNPHTFQKNVDKVRGRARVNDYYWKL